MWAMILISCETRAGVGPVLRVRSTKRGRRGRGRATPAHGIPLSSRAQSHLRARARMPGLGPAGYAVAPPGTASSFPTTPSPSPVAWCPFPIPRSLRSSSRRTRGAPHRRTLSSTPRNPIRQDAAGQRLRRHAPWPAHARRVCGADGVTSRCGSRGDPRAARRVQARDRLGDQPLEALFATTAAQWATASATEHRWRGLAVYGVDGSRLRIPDTPENDQTFGRPKSGRGRAGYPQGPSCPMIHSRLSIAASCPISCSTTSSPRARIGTGSRVPRKMALRGFEWVEEGG
jgi:hypothetical protein